MVVIYIIYNDPTVQQICTINLHMGDLDQNEGGWGKGEGGCA